MRGWACKILPLVGILVIVMVSGCAEGAPVQSHARGDAANPYAGGETPSEAPCDPELEFFRDSVWTPILSVRCVGCHNEGGAAKDSDLIFTQDGDDAALVQNFHAAASLAFRTLGDTSELLLRPTNTHPEGHTGGELFELGSVQHEILSEFVAMVTDVSCDEGPGATSCEEPVPGRRSLRRLTHDEYENTVRDLLGVDSEMAERFAPDTVVHGFANHGDALTVSPLLMEQYSASARSIADAAMLHLDRIVPRCESTWTSEECAENFIRTFGERAFRRPVTDTDITRYMRVYRAGAQGEGFESGVRWLLIAVLQSPSFLYRREIGTWDEGSGLYLLDDYEIASELSYLILSSMPDEALFAAARAGELRTQEQILAQAQRLITLEPSRAALRRFIERWLDLERLQTVPKDADTYPELTPEMRESMRGELERFIDHVAFEGTGTLEELLTADYTFVDDRLSALYGMEASGTPDAQGFRQVSLAEGERRGITTLGGYLTTHARSNSSSPVERGLIVRERIFCQELPPPPPGVIAEPPAPDAARTTRERYSEHSTNAACSNCHSLVDPIGFSYEHFDGIGRWRFDEQGHDIDATGSIIETASTNFSFDGAAELTDILATSSDVHDCFTLQWVRYGYGVTENGRLSCMVDELAESFRDGDMSIAELIVSLTQTPHFVSREGEAPTPGGAPEPEPEPEPEPGTGGAGEGSGGSGTTEPEPTPGLDIHVMTDSDWGAGYCKKVKVLNAGASDVTWNVVLDIEGSLNEGSPWNATVDARSGRVTFRGVDWNASLSPGASADFGFCATR